MRLIISFGTAVLLLLALGAADSNLRAAKTKDPWKEWLKEIDPILTRLERSVAKLLNTEEERNRFQELFWKARDPDPQTPRNEYKEEFYRRISYAKQYLKGVNSDRGRIYILLGEPTGKNSYTGYNSLVESEVWSYEGNNRPGLLPFMNLVFFRPHNTGDYQLYYPGVHRPTDLLAPQYAERIKNPIKAYREIKQTSTELAGASLSIIPGEGDPRFGMSVGSSNFALSRIYSLPEQEAEAGYVRSFMAPTGHVEVSHSTNAIRGFGSLAITRNKGVPFVNFALVPDVINWKQPAVDTFTTEIRVNISIEDTRGNIIYQNQRDIDLKLDPAKKREAAERRVVIRDFAPIIPGEYNVLVTFSDKSTQAFYTYQGKISVPPANSTGTTQDKTIVSAVVGYDIKEINTGNFIPFAADNELVLTDPRYTFSQEDSLCGIVWVEPSAESRVPPELVLEKINDETVKVKITPELSSNQDQSYRFRQSLKEIKDGNYRLIAKTGDGQTTTVVEKIHILPFYIKVTKPFTIEKTEPASARNNYIFVRGQQYLEAGNVEQAVACFRQIPVTLWHADSIPIIARAFYEKGDYARVMELLEKEEVKKEYPVLLMLANSSIELRLYPKALEYLEKIRKYGETEEIDHLLAATYLNMGDRHNAMKYYERARTLKNSPPEPGEQQKNNDSQHDSPRNQTQSDEGEKHE